LLISSTQNPSGADVDVFSFTLINKIEINNCEDRSSLILSYANSCLLKYLTIDTTNGYAHCFLSRVWCYQ